MTKNDYIEKITQNLEHLTKDELKDVSILTTAQLGVRSKFAERQQLEHKIANLTPQLQQQALPVVPEWLDIEIKHFKSTSKHPTVDVVFGVADAIVAVKNGNTHSKLYDYLFCGKQDVCNQHQAAFALAFITGKYQVEKPQLFYLRNKLTGLWLMRDGVDKVYPYDHTTYIGHRDKFTQQEIESMETGSYEQIEVAE
ncbi:DUF1642 domain-containing protein [Lactococcus lactis]|uniref:DUF1642 domain-containing protein n=1 Tax=Lactococcus lactis TaxID=1358 RepID=UPI0001C0541B|nr:DUF1642 domain-containing protein [Lactococcus lactis]ADA64751.1 Phage protein [Lactococcus lactis subsp. lactis KF147]